MKRIKIINNDLGEGMKEKGDMDVDITVDAMYHIDKYDTAIFFSGDSDFLPLVSHLKTIIREFIFYHQEIIFPKN